MHSLTLFLIENNKFSEGRYGVTNCPQKEEIEKVIVFHVLRRCLDVVWHLLICLAAGVYDWTYIKSNVQKDKLEENKNECQ